MRKTMPAPRKAAKYVNCWVEGICKLQKPNLWESHAIDQPKFYVQQYWLYNFHPSDLLAVMRTDQAWRKQKGGLPYLETWAFTPLESPWTPLVTLEREEERYRCTDAEPSSIWFMSLSDWPAPTPWLNEGEPEKDERNPCAVSQAILTWLLTRIFVPFWEYWSWWLIIWYRLLSEKVAKETLTLWAGFWRGWTTCWAHSESIYRELFPEAPHFDTGSWSSRSVSCNHSTRRLLQAMRL